MSGKSRGKLSIDRLSSLPDGVICHILSFLPTKLSVSTCVLAKRWRFLWAYVPVWDFEGNYFEEHFVKDETPNPDVIYRVILWHKAKTMRTLRLHDIDCNEYQLETWISTAIGRKIQNIYLDSVFSNIVKLHRPLFNCKTVVDMRLRYCKGFSSTADIWLPNLKKLHLSEVEFEDNEALPHLLSGCPLLQELILDCTADGTDIRFLKVISSTITMLEVNCIIYWDYSVPILTIVPALRCLRMVDFDLDCITIPIDMASLAEVDISFSFDFLSGNNDSSNVVQFFNSLCNIMCLKISCNCDYLQVIIDKVVGSVIKFNNLTKLELQSWGVKWHFLIEFLEVADNVKVLIVDVVNCNSCTEPKQVPKCLLSSVKTITIKQPSFEEHKLDLVRYLLRNSQVPERMKVLPRKSRGFLKNDITAAFKALQRVSLFERGSKACQLAFFSDC